MNYKMFKIIGVNSETGRKKTLRLGVPNAITPQEMVLQQGLLKEPLEIEEISFEPATDRQLEYALSLGIKIPHDAYKNDLSALIDRAIEHDNESNPELIEYATDKGMMFSEYIGKNRLYSMIFSELSIVDRIAFFCFSVYRDLSGDMHANLDTSPLREIFYEFAEQYTNDKKFTASLERYAGHELQVFGTVQVESNDGIAIVSGGSVRTYAYKIVAEYLRDKLGTPLTRTKTLSADDDDAYAEEFSRNTPNSDVRVVREEYVYLSNYEAGIEEDDDIAQIPEMHKTVATPTQAAEPITKAANLTTPDTLENYDKRTRQIVRRCAGVGACVGIFMFFAGNNEGTIILNTVTGITLSMFIAVPWYLMRRFSGKRRVLKNRE